MADKKFWPSLSVNSKKKKKNCNPYFIVIMITVLIMNVIFWVVNFKTQNLSFLLHRKFTSGYLCTIALILFIHIGFLKYLSFKQFKLIVKMTTIESGVTIPKGLFTLYLNVKYLSITRRFRRKKIVLKIFVVDRLVIDTHNMTINFFKYGVCSVYLALKSEFLTKIQGLY
jgi:hypothetical protein